MPFNKSFSLGWSAPKGRLKSKLQLQHLVLKSHIPMLKTLVKKMK